MRVTIWFDKVTQKLDLVIIGDTDDERAQLRTLARHRAQEFRFDDADGGLYRRGNAFATPPSWAR